MSIVGTRLRELLDLWRLYSAPEGQNRFANFFLRAKASICIMIGCGQYHYKDYGNARLVAIGPCHFANASDGPYVDWAEVLVARGWRRWYFSRTRNVRPLFLPRVRSEMTGPG